MSGTAKKQPEEISHLVRIADLGAIEFRDITTILDGDNCGDTVGIGYGIGDVRVLDLVLNNGLKHVCQDENVCFESELNTSALMLLSPETFIEKPLASILDPVNAIQKPETDFRSWYLKFKRAGQKAEALKEIEQHLGGLVKSQSVISDICGVMDELFTNAVFNAPFVNPDTAENPGISRSNLEIEMPQTYEGEAFIGYDAERVVVGVRDPFGSLNVNKLFGKIRDCYENGVESNINMGPGGAGIGSYMVYSASASYYAAIRKGFATIVCCSIPIKMSSRKRASLPKNIHYIEETEDAATKTSIKKGE